MHIWAGESTDEETVNVTRPTRWLADGSNRRGRR